MNKEKIKLIKEQAFRSKPLVSMNDDMIRVTLDMHKNKWRWLKKLLYDNFNALDDSDIDDLK